MGIEMREVGAFEAKNRLGALLDEVERGAEIVITRHGKPVAKLVSARNGHDRVAAHAAAGRISERAKGATLGRLTVKALVEDGRR
jgi:prevent-host-death family protein